MDRWSTLFQHLQKILRRRGRSREDAEDLIQEAFLRMHEYCGGGGEVRKPEGFLVRTALRLAINARRDAHQHLYAERDAEQLALIVDRGPTPDEVLAGDQCLTRMRDVLDAVSPRTREIFFMHRLDGMSYAQIAQRVGVSVSAIEKHMASALVALSEVSEEP